jgi:PHD/YefM family antitoxin component YafN of YafNO toxin-antitoxin module
MRTSVVELRKTMSDTINRVAFEKERIILERNGKDMLALVPMADLALLEKLEDEADVKAARAALAEIERTGEKPIPWEQVKAKLAAKRLREKKKGGG